MAEHPTARSAERARERQAAEHEALEEARILRSQYAQAFGSEAGKAVLDDLVERFDPIVDTPPMTGEQAIYLAAVRRVMHHVRDQLGEGYALAIARVDERSRRR